MSAEMKTFLVLKASHLHHLQFLCSKRQNLFISYITKGSYNGWIQFNKYLQRIMPFYPSGSTKWFYTFLPTSGNSLSITSSSLSCLLPCSKNLDTSLTVPIMLWASTTEHELAIDRFSIWLQQ